MRKELIIGICFVTAGVLCACLFGYDYFSTYGFLNAYHVRAFAEMKIDLPTLFASIVWKRGELFFLIWLVAYTPAKRIAPLILRCSLFFTAGMFAGACLINMGAFGLIVFLGSWFPHGIFYLLAILMLLGRESHKGYAGSGRLGKKIAFVVLFLSLFLLGCAAEASAGTWILQKLFSVLANMS